MKSQYPDAVICVHNEGNEVSLQLWKVYKPLRDDDARSEGFLRVIDESGEDYLFPEENFVAIGLPAEVKEPFERAMREQRLAPAQAAAVSGSVRRMRSGAAKRAKNRNGD